MIVRQAVTILGAFLLAVAACACGGSGRTATLPPLAAHASPVSAAQAVTFTVFVPGGGSASTSSAKRAPQYLPTTVNSISFQQTKNGGSPVSPPVVIVPIGGASCVPSAGGQTCTVNLTASDGAAMWSVGTYASTNGTGTPLSVNTLSINVVQGAANVQALTLNPVPTALAWVPNSASCTWGVASTVPAVLQIEDTTGAIIIGPGSFATSLDALNPITISVGAAHVNVQTASSTAAPTTLNVVADDTVGQLDYTGNDTGWCPVTIPVTATAVGLSGTYTITLGGTAVVSTFSGNGTVGFVNGAPTMAQFNSPSAMVPDASGNLYVADTFSEAIRKVDTSGNVTTYAGTGSAGALNGPAATATFHWPVDVAFDSSGNLYVADELNNEVRKISSGGVVSNYAPITSPAGVAVDSSGNVYVSSVASIYKIVAGSPVLFAGSGTVTSGFTNGPALSALFTAPKGLHFDSSGNLYVADSGNAAIREISGGVVSTYANLAPGGFTSPRTMAVDAAGNMFVASARYDIAKIAPGGSPVTQYAGISTGFLDGAATCAEFQAAAGVAEYGGNLFVADTSNERIREITP